MHLEKFHWKLEKSSIGKVPLLIGTALQGAGFHFLPYPLIVYNVNVNVNVNVKSLSRVRLSATPWNVAYQVPLSMGFSRQEYWSGLPFPSPGNLPNAGINNKPPIRPMNMSEESEVCFVQGHDY